MSLSPCERWNCLTQLREVQGTALGNLGGMKPCNQCAVNLASMTKSEKFCRDIRFAAVFSLLYLAVFEAVICCCDSPFQVPSGMKLPRVTDYI